MTAFTCDRCRTTLALHPDATWVTRETWADERDQHERGQCPGRQPAVEPGKRLVTALWVLAVVGVWVAALWAMGVGR